MEVTSEQSNVVQEQQPKEEVVAVSPDAPSTNVQSPTEEPATSTTTTTTISSVDEKATPKKKNPEASKSGFLSNLFKKKESEPYATNKDKIDKIIKTIKNDTDTLLNLMRMVNQDKTTDTSSLANQVDHIFRDISQIYGMIGDINNTTKTLKHHIRDLHSKTGERSSIWKVWTDMINDDYDTRQLMLESTFLETSIKSALNDQLSPSEAIVFEELLISSMIPAIDASNLCRLICQFSLNKARIELNVLILLVESITAYKARIPKTPKTMDSLLQAIHKSVSNVDEINTVCEKQVSECNDNYSKQNGIYEKIHNERKDQLDRVETDLARETKDMAEINERIHNFNLELEEMQKRKVALDVTMTANKKKLEELKKDEKRELANKNEMEDCKTRFHSVSHLSESIQKLISCQPDAIESLINNSIGIIEQNLQKHSDDKVKIENEISELEKDKPTNDARVDHLKGHLIKMKEMVDSISKIAQAIETRCTEYKYHFHVESIKNIVEKCEKLFPAPVVSQPPPQSQVVPDVIADPIHQEPEQKPTQVQDSNPAKV